MQLTEYLDGAEQNGFTPKPFYSREGDTLSFFAKDEEFHAARLDDVVTVYKSNESNELIGFKLKGVRRLLDRLGNFGILVTDNGVALGAIVMAACVEASNETRQEYERLGPLSRNINIDPRELEPAGVSC